MFFFGLSSLVAGLYQQDNDLLQEETTIKQSSA